MTRGRRLVEAFAAAASRYAPEDEPRKRALLADLEGVAVRDAGTLLRLHEALCFLQAYPDNAKMLEHVDRALERFGARVHRLGTAARPRLHDSGVTHTILDYPFGFPMARWLAARFPRESDVAWPAFADADRLDETLSLLATAAEGDAFSEGGSAGGSGFASPRAAAEVFLMLPGSSPAPDRRPACRRWSPATSRESSAVTALGPRATRSIESRACSAYGGAPPGRPSSGVPSSACRSSPPSFRISRHGRSPSGARSSRSCGPRAVGARWPTRGGSTGTAAYAEASKLWLAHSPAVSPGSCYSSDS